jgi:hypothetical protein
MSSSSLLDTKIDHLIERVMKNFSPAQLRMIAVGGSLRTAFRRFLIYQDLNEKKVYKQFCESLAWKEKHNISCILTEAALSIVKRKMLRRCYPQSFHGHDLNGHPLWIERTAYLETSRLQSSLTDDEAVQSHIQLAEYVQRVMFKQAVGFLLVSSPSHISVRSTTRQASE